MTEFAERTKFDEQGARRIGSALRLGAGLVCLYAGALLAALVINWNGERQAHSTSLVTVVNFVIGSGLGAMFLFVRPLVQKLPWKVPRDAVEPSAPDAAAKAPEPAHNPLASSREAAPALAAPANPTPVDDIAHLERKHAQLRKAIARLRTSRKVVRRQNHELKALARRDPLTGCFNRRTLFTKFERLWEAAKRLKRPISCIMVDVDHFKSVNDRFGHQVGDAVLKHIAATLRSAARKFDVVCRYGGEEFCVLLPHVDLVEAEVAAERFRHALLEQPPQTAVVTASFGISSCCLGATHPLEMMEQADRALYAAKRSGRNKVMCFDRVPEDMLERAANVCKQRVTPPPKETHEAAISFQAVSGLLAALGYRHAETAEHCRRVADLCVTAANGLMSQKDAYLMEMAALLHDIGKLGVPDNVLLKPGPLSPDEWKTIRTHEGIGVEIIRAAFTSDQLADLVRLQNCWFGGSPNDPALPKGQDIPLEARLIAVANAYDAMTTDHSYRKSISQAEAVAELRRCCDAQFDPYVVEHFVKAITDVPSEKKVEPLAPLAISKQIALKIGVQIEKLALAADVQDLTSLVAMASQLRDMANESGIGAIADAAAKLEQSAAANSNQMDLMELTIDLLEMCRQTQRALLPAIPRSDKSKRNRPKSSAEAIQLKIAEADLAEAKLADSSPTPILLARPRQYVKKPPEVPAPRGN